jgi:hypothetical protein
MGVLPVKVRARRERWPHGVDLEQDVLKDALIGRERKDSYQNHAEEDAHHLPTTRRNSVAPPPPAPYLPGAALEEPYRATTDGPHGRTIPFHRRLSMKKLVLDLNALRVDQFAVEPEVGERGTAVANMVTIRTCTGDTCYPQLSCATGNPCKPCVY